MIDRATLYKELFADGLDPDVELDAKFLQVVDIILDRIDIDVQYAIDTAIARHADPKGYC